MVTGVTGRFDEPEVLLPQPMRGLMNQRTASSLLTALILWLCGSGCVLCCSADVLRGCCMIQMTACSREPSPTAHRCTADCCTEDRQLSTESDQAICDFGVGSCPLLGKQINGLVSRSSSLHSADSRTTIAGSSRRLFGSEPGARAHQPPIRVANRGSTYLRCCVLLI